MEKLNHYTGWRLLRLYWQSGERFSAYLLLISVMLFTIILVGLDVALTTWYNYFYNALQDYDKQGTIDLLAIFCLIVAVIIVLSVYRYYMQQYLALRWRRWLTWQFLSQWLQHHRYYYLENFDEGTDNPDQRIQEDIGSLVQLSLALSIGIISSIVTIFAFVYVLWELSGVLVVPLGALGTYHLHGYLVWVSIIYASIGSILTFKIGRPLVSLNFEQQRREANFRFAAIDLRSHAEHVALYRGEKNQETLLRRLFAGVLENWYAIILRQKLLLWFTAGYNQAAVIIPLVVALPNYFNKVFKLGGLIQALSAFGKIQDALSFLVNAYTTIAEWRAVMQRLLTFLNHMYSLEESALKQNHLFFASTPAPNIITEDVSIQTSQGIHLLNKVSETFVHGKHYVIKGPSGIGKSTFVRTIAGIWPYGTGHITLPQKKNILFLPQTAYMPLGTLREALLFPHSPLDYSDDQLIQWLHDCDLSHLVDQLNTVAHWTERLSPGELQRIAFVRVLIQQPDWVFLDETTSSLDLPHEKQLYQLLKTKLLHCSIVSVGHRPSLDEYHDISIDLEKYSPAY